MEVIRIINKNHQESILSQFMKLGYNIITLNTNPPFDYIWFNESKHEMGFTNTLRPTDEVVMLDNLFILEPKGKSDTLAFDKAIEKIKRDEIRNGIQQMVLDSSYFRKIKNTLNKISRNQESMERKIDKLYKNK